MPQSRYYITLWTQSLSKATTRLSQPIIQSSRLRITMIACVLSASWLMYTTIMATPVHLTQHLNGHCVQLDLPVSATAPSAIYHLPQVNSNIEAAAWAIYDATWTTPHNTSSVVRNTTTSGIFKHSHTTLHSKQSQEWRRLATRH